LKPVSLCLRGTADGYAEGLSCGVYDRARLGINAARFRAFQACAAPPRFAARCERRLIPRLLVPVLCPPRGRNGAALKAKGMRPMTTTKTLLRSDLHQFTGSEYWYRHELVRDLLYTDGVKYVAETGGAYWLVDEIALAQQFDKLIAAEEFQLWKLKVNADHSATLVCEDGDCRAVFTKVIEFTDFPLAEISFYLVNSTILLPSEY
jgi:hypothetical protein